MSSKKAIVEYYNKTYKDYRVLYGLDKTLSIHYGFYDGNNKTQDKAVINMNKVLASIAKITVDDTVLDAGCGIGGSSIWLAKNIGCKVIGITLSERQAFLASKLAQRNNVSNLVQFFVKDFTSTKFPSNSFDVVWGLESICYAKNKRDFLSEARRILRKGGRIIVADGFLKKERLTSPEEKYMNKWREGWAVPNLATINEFQKYLKELKFRNVKFKDIRKNVMPTSKFLYLASILSFPLGKIFEYIGLRSKVEAKNTISAYYQYILLKKGICTYGIFYGEK